MDRVSEQGPGLEQGLEQVQGLEPEQGSEQDWMGWVQEKFDGHRPAPTAGC